MYSVSNAYSKAINADTRNVLYRVTLAGVVIADQTRIPKMTISESVGDTTGIAIGTANSSTLTLTLRKADTINYTDVLVEPESGLVLPDGSIEWLPLGKFWVTDFQTSNDYETVNLSCADGMYHLTDEYVSELTYPTDIQNVMNEIVKQTGIIFASSLPTLDIRVKPEGMTYREVVGHLAGCCGCNARFNRLGQLEFFWYEDSGITVEREQQYLNGMTKLNDKPLEVTFDVVGQKEMYMVTCIAGDNGGLTATPGQNVVEGETVVLSINPSYGYELADISAVTDAGDAVTLFMDSEGGREFVQPDSNVTVTASFRLSEGGSYKLTLRSDDNGSIRADKTEFAEGEMATFYVLSNDGYEVEKITTIPASVSPIFVGTVVSSGEKMYEFAVPKSDVTVTVTHKKVSVPYSISIKVDEGQGGGIYVQEVGGRDIITQAMEGTMLGVTFLPDEGYVLDHFDSSVGLTQIGKHSYTFIMPATDISFTAYFKLSVDDSKARAYSWLQSPTLATPPTSKPYWAVVYNEDEYLPTCQKYYLVWFDSWEATAYSDEEYTIKFHGYYYCGGKNKGHGSHEWDTSTWSGNGASGSSLEWDVRVDRLCADWDDYYGPTKQYCLLASNVHLYYRDSLVFENCETSISATQTSYLQDGMDVREKGTLTQWYCPDTFSTPAPAANWMVLMPESGLYMTMGEDGKYNSFTGYYPDSLIAFFYDSVTIQNLGVLFSDTDEELYLASFTNARWTYLRDNVLGWDEEIHDLPEGAVIGLRSPLNSTASGYGYVDGNSYQFAGVLVTSETLYDTNGNVFMYKNSCRICDCEGEVATTFSLRKTRSVVNADSVTITYKNPLVYEKMVADVSSLVQGITYTPAKVKHRGNPAFQVGDIIRTPDKNGDYHNVIIMQQTMNFGGGMNAEITSPGQTEKTKSFSSRGSMTVATKKEVKQAYLDLERRLNSNNALVYAALYKTIGANEAKISEIVEWQTEKAATKADLELTAKDLEASIQAQADVITANTKSIGLLDITVKEQSALLDMLVDWQDETSRSVAGVQATAEKNKASIEAQAELITANSESIASIAGRVTEKEAQVEILANWKDNLKIGGRNLIPNTATPTGLKAAANNNYSNKTIEPTVPLWHGGIYSFGVDVKVKSGVSEQKITIGIFNAAFDVGNKCDLFDVDIIDGHVSKTFIIRNTTEPKYIIVYCGKAGSTASNEVVFSNMKLEEGGVPTAWTPAPEDTINSLAKIEAKASANETSLGLFVENGNVKASILMEAINNDKSSIKINADKVDIAGNLSALSANIGPFKITNTSLTCMGDDNWNGTYIATDGFANYCTRNTDDNKYLASMRGVYVSNGRLGCTIDGSEELANIMDIMEIGIRGTKKYIYIDIRTNTIGVRDEQSN